MSYGEEQRKEIETIKKRQIKLELSDADCDRLARKCGEYGLTIGELIENFVGDLVDGTYSNGSDDHHFRWSKYRLLNLRQNFLSALRLSDHTPRTFSQAGHNLHLITQA